MDISLEQYLVLFSASMLAVGLLTPLMRLIAVRLNVVDSPDQSHKTHRIPIPYLGGVAIILGVLGVTSLSLIGYSMSQANTILALSLLLPAVSLGLIGLVDDIRNLNQENVMKSCKGCNNWYHPNCEQISESVITSKRSKWRCSKCTL